MSKLRLPQDDVNSQLQIKTKLNAIKNASPVKVSPTGSLSKTSGDKEPAKDERVQGEKAIRIAVFDDELFTLRIVQGLFKKYNAAQLKNWKNQNKEETLESESIKQASSPGPIIDKDKPFKLTVGDKDYIVYWMVYQIASPKYGPEEIERFLNDWPFDGIITDNDMLKNPQTGEHIISGQYIINLVRDKLESDIPIILNSGERNFNPETVAAKDVKFIEKPLTLNENLVQFFNQVVEHVERPESIKTRTRRPFGDTTSLSDIEGPSFKL